MSTLYCAFRNLTSVPVFDPYAEPTPGVSLQANRIRRLEAFAFANLSVDTTVKIILRANPIEYVDDLAFDGLQNYTVDLDLTDTQLTASPKALVALKNLRKLTTDLPFLPAVSEKLDSLKVLYITSGSFKETLDGICSLPNLTKLVMYDNIFEPGVSPLPKCARPMRSVEEVTLIFLNMTVFPAEFSESFPSLKRLDVSHNHLVSIPNSIVSSSLTHLNLGYNLLTTIPAHTFIGLQSLDTLDLSSNPLSSIADNALENNPKLLHLNLFNSKLTTVPKCIRHFSTLQIIVSMNPIKCTCDLAWLHTWDAFTSGSVDVFGRCEDNERKIFDFVSSLQTTCEGQPIGR